MSLQRTGESQEHDKAKKIQDKIKLMMKNKMMQKLTSQRDLTSQKPVSIYNNNILKKFDNYSTKTRQQIVFQKHLNNQQNYEIRSSKRLKSTTSGEQFAPLASISLKKQSNKWMFSNKGKAFLFQDQSLKKTPSAQKLQSLNQSNREIHWKLKRPSSVINRSQRGTTLRNRQKKHLLPQDHKAMQQKVRSIIQHSFQTGTKLHKYAEQSSINLSKQSSILFSQQINILRLINSCKKYYLLKFQNQEEQQHKLSCGVQKQIIQMLKKRKEKQLLINKCESITDQISRLIQSRLAVLKKTRTAL